MHWGTAQIATALSADTCTQPEQVMAPGERWDRRAMQREQTARRNLSGRDVWSVARRLTLRGLRLGVGLLMLGLMLGILAPGAPVAFLDGGAPNLAYVVGGGTDGRELVIVDVAKRAVTGRVNLGAAGSSVALSGDASVAYVALPSAGTVAVVDATRRVVTANIAVGGGPQVVLRGFSRGTSVLFVTVAGRNAVAMVNPATRTVLATIPVGAHPVGEALAGQGSGIVDSDINDAQLYVANTGSDSVSVLSTDQRTVLATIPMPEPPLQIVIPATGGIAYVATTAGGVYALSLAHHSVLGKLLQLPGNSAPGQMDYDAVTGQIYVPDPAGSVVEVLAPTTDSGSDAAPRLPIEPARTIPLPGGPAAVAITFDGSFGFVAERDSGRIVMLDVASHQTLATIAVGGAPRAVLTGAYPPALPAESSPTGIVVGSGLALLFLLALGGFVVWRRREAWLWLPGTIKKREKHS
ncbi:MAG: hypothetical protein ACRDHP_05535 [Ktedonobacterales bacterium]